MDKRGSSRWRAAGLRPSTHPPRAGCGTRGSRDELLLCFSKDGWWGEPRIFRGFLRVFRASGDVAREL